MTNAHNPPSSSSTIVDIDIAATDPLELSVIEHPEAPPTTLSCHELNALIESIFKLDYGELFGDAHDLEKMLDPLAFVLFHPEHEHGSLRLFSLRIGRGGYLADSWYGFRTATTRSNLDPSRGRVQPASNQVHIT